MQNMHHLSLSYERKRKVKKTGINFSSPMGLKISFRKGKQEDLDFLFDLKKATLQEYVMQTWGWDEEFQRAHHKQNVNPENFTIIQASGRDIGCLLVEPHPNSIFLGVIELLPAFQNQGIGSRIIKDLLKKGEQEAKDVELQVLKANQRALRLYQSLGFIITNETGTHYQLLYSVDKA